MDDNQVGKLADQLQHSYEEALSRKEQPPAPAELFADRSTIDARLAHATTLAELGLDDALSREPGAKKSHRRGDGECRSCIRRV